MLSESVLVELSAQEGKYNDVAIVFCVICLKLCLSSTMNDYDLPFLRINSIYLELQLEFIKYILNAIVSLYTRLES